MTSGRTTSSCCRAPSSSRMKPDLSRPAIGRPVLSCTVASTSTLITSACSTKSKAARSTRAVALRPLASVTSAVITVGANGLSSIQSIAYTGPSASCPTGAPLTKNFTPWIATSPTCSTRATMRTAPGVPVRPSGDVMRMASGGSSARSLTPAATARISAAARIALRKPRRSALCVIDEIAVARRGDEGEGEAGGLAAVLGERERLLDEIARMTAAHRQPARPVALGQDALDQGPVEGDAALGAGRRPDPGEVVGRGALGEHLVADAAQERLVHQIARADVGGERNQRDERQLELLAGLQREIVDAALERHDPAVQQVARRDALPPEVVDHQHAAVGERLQRRPIESRDRQVAELERVQRELAAHRDQRPPAAHPAAILHRTGFDERLALGDRNGLVHHRIEDADDLALDG